MRYIKRTAGIDAESIKKLADGAGVSSVVAELLISRGIKTPEDAARFLDPSRDMLIDPMRFDAAEETAELIKEMIEAGVPIAVYSDYDCDGVCGAAILYKTITALGGEPKVYIPDRFTEGYGTNSKAIELLCDECGLIITVDCGITSVEDTALARDLGAEVIILDHHECSELPDTPYIWNPHRPGESYPFKELCGAGIAFKLACLLLGEAAMELIDIAAVATVGDMVSLTGENRAIAALGMEKLKSDPCLGLKELIAVSGVKPGKLNSQTLGFALAPRLNVAGRMGSAFRAFDLLTADNEETARECAEYLDDLNDRRKTIQRNITSLADADASGRAGERVIIIKGEGFHKGVVGLAASNIAEKYHRPTIILSEEDGMLTGSARSIDGVDIYDIMSSCADRYTRFGGHSQAAGVSLPAEQFEDFCADIKNAALKTDEALYAPYTSYDAVLSAKEATEELADGLSAMEPFGQGNPQPVFIMRDAYISDSRRVGKNMDCTRAVTDGLPLIRFFGELGKGMRYTLVGCPEINDYQGKRSMQFRVTGAEPEDMEYLRSFPGELRALFELENRDGLKNAEEFFGSFVREENAVLLVGSLPGERVLEERLLPGSAVVSHARAVPEGAERVYLLGCFALKKKHPEALCLYDERMKKEYIREAKRYFVPERALGICFDALSRETGQFDNMSSLLTAAVSRAAGTDIRRMWFAFNVFYEQKLIQLAKGDKIQAIYKKSDIAAEKSATYRAFESFIKGEANARLL